MIETTDGYKAAIKADTEQDSFTVTFGFMPPGSVEGCELDSAEEASLSRLQQVKNGTLEMSAKWGTLERDRFRLDGSYTLMDDRDPAQHFGFFSSVLCDRHGVFSAPPFVDYTFNAAYDLIGVSVYFDAPGGEWASEFIVEYFGYGDTLLQTQTVQNDRVVCLVDMQGIGVKRFRVTVNRWNVPERRAKIAQILPGQIYLFSPENAYEFSFSESIRPFESAVTLPEFTVVFDNADKRFDIVNPKGVVSFLRKKMRVSARLGILVEGAVEEINAGDFYVYAWPDDTQEDKASLTCRPSMAFENRYYENTGRGVQTAQAAAGIIFADIDEAFTVAPELQGIEVNQYIGDDVPKIDAMGQLAVACCAYWKIGRDGTYHLTPWRPPEATNTVDYDNAWSKPSISQRQRYTSVNVKGYSWSSLREQQVSTDHIIALAPDDGEMKTISCPFITDARAELVAQAALAYYGLRLSYSVSYRGDPSIEAGDTVQIENDYALSGVCVFEHEIEFDADKKMSATLKGVGVGG